MGAREWMFGRVVAGKLRSKNMGKLWAFLDGWKTWFMALVMLSELLAAGTGAEGPLGYVRGVANALGWGTIAPEFDPGLVAAAVGTLLATGHKLVKAVAQYRAGVPLAALKP